jgi:hypothetical protein
MLAEEDQMTSFSEYAGHYLKGQDLQGREWLVVIEKIPEEDVGDNDKKLVAYFVGRKKTLPLNKGHIAVLSAAFGDDPNNCRGAQVILYPEPTRTPQGLPAIGVRIKLPPLAAPQPQPQYAPPPSPQPQAQTYAQVRSGEAEFAPNARARAEQAQQAQPQQPPPASPSAADFDDDIPF